MAASLTSARPETNRLPTRDQLDQIWDRWTEGGTLWSAVVSNLMNSASKAYPGGFSFADKIDFDGTDGFTVQDTDMRATVQLSMDPFDTSATVNVATSWALTPQQKLALEADKAKVLAQDLKGHDLNGFVHMKYGTCEPSSKNQPEDKDMEARDPLDDSDNPPDDLENALDGLRIAPQSAEHARWTREDLVRSVRHSRRSATLSQPTVLHDWTKSPVTGFHDPADLDSPYDM